MSLTETLLNNDTLRQFFSGRRRFQLAWIFAFLLMIRARHYPYTLGILICALGAALRFYASGFLRKEAKLTVGGPYSFTRNPLYLGTFIMAFGATLSVGAVGLAVVLGFVFFLNYHYVIEHEEKKLPGIFGQAYLDYCSLVPRFWPRTQAAARAELEKINPAPEGFSFSMDLAKHNKAIEAVWSFVGLMIGCTILVWVKIQVGAIR